MAKLWESIKNALTSGASNSASTGTGNTSKPTTTTKTTTTTTKVATPVVSSTTPRTNSTDLPSSSVPTSNTNTSTKTTATTTPTNSTSSKTITMDNGSNTPFSQAYQKDLASGKVASKSSSSSSSSNATSNIINGSAGGFKAFDNSGQSANEFVNDPNNAAYVKTDTNNISAGEGYVNSDGSAKLITSPTTPSTNGGGVEVTKPTSDLIDTDADVTKGTENASPTKTNDDVTNEIQKINGGQFTGEDGKRYGYLNSSNGIQAQELAIFKGLLAQGYTEEQANQILNSAFASKGITRKKNYQTEDGKWTYSVYGDLENEKVTKLEDAKSSLGTTDTSGMTVTDAKRLYEQKLASLSDDYQKAVEDKDKSKDIIESKKDTALAKKLQQKGMFEAANFQGLGSGNRTQEQLAMDEAYRNKLMELQELESDNTQLLNKLKSEYEKDVTDTENAYENLKTAIREGNAAAAKKAAEDKQTAQSQFAIQMQQELRDEINKGTTNQREVISYINTMYSEGRINKAQYDALISEFAYFIYQ